VNYTTKPSKSSHPSTHSAGSGQAGSALIGSSRSTTMADLMKKSETVFISFQKGDIVNGTITKLTPSEILVNLGTKAEGVVLEKDKNILRNLLSSLKVGDKVTVSILSPESDNGYPVVSLRRFIDSRIWDTYIELQKKQETIDVTVLESIKGGFLVTAGGTSGFLPNSQTTFVDNPQELVGKKLAVYILEIHQKDHKIIFSQKPPVTDEMVKKIGLLLKNGQKITSRVSSITPFGLFVSIQADGDMIVDGFVHISEIAWKRTEDIAASFTVGQTIDAVVVRFDREAKRVELSIKRLTDDPFTALAKRYPVDKKVKAKVTRVVSTGLSLIIEDTEVSGGIEGFIRKEAIPPTLTYEVGIVLDAIVSEVDTKRHKIVLVPVLKEKPIGYR